ncbi:hypothetical protein [Paenibacillus amylolyticus]|uniref:hypothetical protein n=1 Tax=Paenibacillus amylolyticus TaxID=1451 RepID=UPI00201DD255|nr:hypothetical protein [Paenibacillus amylolyticus]MCL6664559.1 hypothetical protein [Paenibacillus amylolyticus]
MIDFIIKSLNYIIAGVGAAFTWLLNLLPNSPFATPAAPPNSVNLGWLTWFIPFPTMFLHLVAVVGAIAVYYVIRVAARWLKVARS